MIDNELVKTTIEHENSVMVRLMDSWTNVTNLYRLKKIIALSSVENKLVGEFRQVILQLSFNLLESSNEDTINVYINDDLYDKTVKILNKKIDDKIESLKGTMVINDVVKEMHTSFSAVNDIVKDNLAKEVNKITLIETIGEYRGSDLIKRNLRDVIEKVSLRLIEAKLPTKIKLADVYNAVVKNKETVVFAPITVFMGDVSNVVHNINKYTLENINDMSDSLENRSKLQKKLVEDIATYEDSRDIDIIKSNTVDTIKRINYDMGRTYTALKSASLHIKTTLELDTERLQAGDDELVNPVPDMDPVVILDLIQQDILNINRGIRDLHLKLYLIYEELIKGVDKIEDSVISREVFNRLTQDELVTVINATVTDPQYIAKALSIMLETLLYIDTVNDSINLLVDIINTETKGLKRTIEIAKENE